MMLPFGAATDCVRQYTGIGAGGQTDSRRFDFEAIG